LNLDSKAKEICRATLWNENGLDWSVSITMMLKEWPSHHILQLKIKMDFNFN